MLEDTAAAGVDDDEEATRRGEAIVAGLRARPTRVARVGPEVAGYVIPPDGKIGEGEFSEVYRARDLNLSRDVALKILREGHRADEVQRARMENEARALARLQATDHVLQIHDRTRTADGRPCLVLEWVDHGSLHDRLKESGPMEARPAASIVAKIAGAVGAMHALGLIHRDLKPSNLLMTRDDQPKLADFGLARFDQGPDDLTIVGQILGTPGYMSPEQARGRGAEVGPASDVYSIGAILYACLTGRAPFEGPNRTETILSIVDQDLVPPERLVPSVPRDLSTICRKCLNKKKEARYSSAGELGEDLGNFLAGRPIKARRAGRAERLAKLVRRNKTVSAMVGLVVLSVAAGVVASGLYARKAKAQEVRANKNAEQRFVAPANVLQSVTGDKLRRAGQRALQVQLVGDLLPRFEEVLQLEGNDPATRRLQGMAWINLAIARRELGQGPGALQAAEDAVKIMRGLIAEGAFAEDASVGLATALGYRGAIIGQGGKFAEAIADLDESVKLLEPRANDETPALLERLAHAHNNWANCLRFGGGGTPTSLEAANFHYRAAIDIFGRGARTLLTCRDWQARTLGNLALFVAETLKRPAEALHVARQAADLARGMLHDHPDELDCRECLATCLTNVAEIQATLESPAAVRPLFAEALTLYERLSSQVQDSAEFRWSVAMAASNLGASLTATPGDDPTRAGELFERADILYRKLLEQSPSNADLADYAAKNRDRLDRLRKARQAAPGSD